MAGVPFRGFRRKGYLNMTNKRELEGKALPFCEEAEELSYEEFLWESGDDLHEDGPEYQSVTEDPAEPAAAELAAPGSQGIARVPDAMVKAPAQTKSAGAPAASPDRITCTLKEHYGVLSHDANGWCKELNLVSWNGGMDKFDIRSWDHLHQKKTRGITLRTEEVENLYRILDGLYGAEHDAAGSMS